LDSNASHSGVYCAPRLKARAEGGDNGGLRLYQGELSRVRSGNIVGI
jgi:hypothetical protein